MATSRTTFQEAVFTPDGARPTERVYNLSRQVLEFRRAIVPWPSCSTAGRTGSSGSTSTRPGSPPSTALTARAPGRADG
jgi:hypothetical protein